MIPAVIIPMFYSLAGHGLSENAEKRVWTGALIKHVRGNRMQTGKLEKTSPLPVGRYWIDIFEKGRATWQQWVKDVGPDIHILATETFPADIDYPGSGRDWILFEVLYPPSWGNELAKTIGWPTIASKNIEHSSNTSQTPEPEGLFGGIKSPGIKLAIGGVAIAGIALGAAYVFRSFK